jgi:hypothetical protein
MLLYDAAIGTGGCCEPGPTARAGQDFASLLQTPMASRFLAWQGGSGRSYIFSVFAAADCPAFCDAILMAVARDDRGGRRILTAIDTGAFPEPVLARAEQEFCAAAQTLEFHVHLLARTLIERRAALADLGERTSLRRATR